jgi:predicted enzyme related to lactoylglutathione lyase
MNGRYTEFQLDGKSIAGMSAIESDNPEVPPHWQVIFTVENCASSLEKAQSLGGSLLFGPMAVPGVGNFAVLADPQGAVFGIVD